MIYTGLNSLNAKYDQVLCESTLASEHVIEYLIGLGHTKIAYVGETQNEERYVGYCSTLRKHKIPVQNEFVSNVMLCSEGGYRGTKALLAKTREMTAIFAPNDLTAIGVMRAIQEAGLKIPEDISVSYTHLTLPTIGG